MCMGSIQYTASTFLVWQPRMVDEISALGLRHVGYGIPTET